MSNRRSALAVSPALVLPYQLGLENEGWTYRMDGDRHMPVDVASFVESFGEKLAAGKIFRESGIGSIEFASGKASSVADAVAKIAHLHGVAAENGYNVLYRNQSPYPRSVHARTLETGKSRFQAIVAAAQEESPDGWEELLRQNFYAALHLHISFADFPVRPDYVAEEMVFVNNVLNLIGPRVAKIICQKYEVTNVGHLGIFSKWAHYRRFSYHGQWYAGFEDMKRQLLTLTRFIHCVKGDKEHGDWEKDLRTPMVWGDHDVAELGLWPISRLRTRQGTLEARLLPSIGLEHLESAVHDVVDLILYLLSIAPSRGCLVDDIGDFMTSLLWEKVQKFHIGGVAAMPTQYTEAMWREDVFN